MKFTHKKRGIAALLAASILTLTACGSGGAATGTAASAPTGDSAPAAASAASAAEETASGQVQKLVVIGPSAFDQVAYYDENDYLTGFEPEVLRAVDALLPEYEFDFQPSSDFAGYFLSVEEGKADIAYCQIEWNEERAEKYLYGNVSYCNFPERICVLGTDENNYQTLADLAGKKVEGITGGNTEYILEKWNEEHPDQAVDIVLDNGDVTIIDSNLKNGTLDAYIQIERIMSRNNESYGFDHKAVGDVVLDSKCFFIFNLENTELRDRVDEALQTLKDNGTLSELSIQFFGGDYVE